MGVSLREKACFVGRQLSGNRVSSKRRRKTFRGWHHPLRGPRSRWLYPSRAGTPSCSRSNCRGVRTSSPCARECRFSHLRDTAFECCLRIALPAISYRIRRVVTPGYSIFGRSACMTAFLTWTRRSTPLGPLLRPRFMASIAMRGRQEAEHERGRIYGVGVFSQHARVFFWRRRLGAGRVLIAGALL